MADDLRQRVERYMPENALATRVHAELVRLGMAGTLHREAQAGSDESVGLNEPLAFCLEWTGRRGEAMDY